MKIATNIIAVLGLMTLLILVQPVYELLGTLSILMFSLCGIQLYFFKENWKIFRGDKHLKYVPFANIILAVLFVSFGILGLP